MIRMEEKALEQISFRARPVHNKVPIGGVITLRLYLIYTGEDVVDLQQIGPDNIGFTPPDGWTLKEPPGIRSLDVRSPGVQLSKGQRWERTINLRDYFSTITRGKVSLQVTLTIWREEEPLQPYRFSDNCKLEVG